MLFTPVGSIEKIYVAGSKNLGVSEIFNRVSLESLLWRHSPEATYVDLSANYLRSHGYVVPDLSNKWVSWDRFESGDAMM